MIDLNPIEDERGYFARAFCAEEFVQHGLNTSVKQINISANYRKGTLRGLHYQLPSAAEAKFIRCIKGAIFDVIVDLRPESPTYLKHFTIELNAENHAALYIPEMFAHGYQTIVDNTEVLYQVSEFYTPNAEDGLRYDDSKLAIDWPLEVSDISGKDLSWPLLN